MACLLTMSLTGQPLPLLPPTPGPGKACGSHRYCSVEDILFWEAHGAMDLEALKLLFAERQTVQHSTVDRFNRRCARAGPGAAGKSPLCRRIPLGSAVSGASIIFGAGILARTAVSLISAAARRCSAHRKRAIPRCSSWPIERPRSGYAQRRRALAVQGRTRSRRTSSSAAQDAMSRPDFAGLRRRHPWHAGTVPASPSEAAPPSPAVATVKAWAGRRCSLGGAFFASLLFLLAEAAVLVRCSLRFRCCSCSYY